MTLVVENLAPESEPAPTKRPLDLYIEWYDSNFPPNATPEMKVSPLPELPDAMPRVERAQLVAYLRERATILSSTNMSGILGGLKREQVARTQIIKLLETLQPGGRPSAGDGVMSLVRRSLGGSAAGDVKPQGRHKR